MFYCCRHRQNCKSRRKLEQAHKASDVVLEPKGQRNAKIPIAPLQRCVGICLQERAHFFVGQTCSGHAFDLRSSSPSFLGDVEDVRVVQAQGFGGMQETSRHIPAPLLGSMDPHLMSPSLSRWLSKSFVVQLWVNTSALFTDLQILTGVIL